MLARQAQGANRPAARHAIMRALSDRYLHAFDAPTAAHLLAAKLRTGPYSLAGARDGLNDPARMAPPGRIQALASLAREAGKAQASGASR